MVSSWKDGRPIVTSLSSLHLVDDCVGEITSYANCLPYCLGSSMPDFGMSTGEIHIRILPFQKCHISDRSKQHRIYSFFATKTLNQIELREYATLLIGSAEQLEILDAGVIILPPSSVYCNHKENASPAPPPPHWLLPTSIPNTYLKPQKKFTCICFRTWQVICVYQCVGFYIKP